MKCKYQTDINCRYTNQSEQNQTVDCTECELHDDRVRLSPGCLGKSVALATIIIILIILL
jgi:hypothetical protein